MQLTNLISLDQTKSKIVEPGPGAAEGSVRHLAPPPLHEEAAVALEATFANRGSE